MGLSIWQIILVIVLVMLLFGRGKISALMGDVAKGITSFKKGLKDENASTSDATAAKPSIEAGGGGALENAAAPAPEPAQDQVVVDGQKDNKTVD